MAGRVTQCCTAFLSRNALRMITDALTQRALRVGDRVAVRGQRLERVLEAVVAEVILAGGVATLARAHRFVGLALHEALPLPTTLRTRLLLIR